MITGWQNYKVNGKNPLVLYGAGVSGRHFLEKNLLKPAFIIDKNAKTIGNINKIPLKTPEQSAKYLRETEADIIITTVKPEFITEILNSFELLKLHPKSTIYVYHNYDLKTKKYAKTNMEVGINGNYVYGGYIIFSQVNWIAKKTYPTTLQKHFPNINKAKNLDEIFDILELALWKFKWNKNRQEQLWLAKQAYLAYIHPILSENKKLAEKFQNRINILCNYFDYILLGDFSKAKASNKIPNASADFKISVIVPVYNNEGAIKKTFNSIIAQSYEHSKIEVLFVDNSSTDNSVCEIKKLIARYKGKISFKVFVLKGHDQWHARNIGVEKAKGKYVIFLDAGSQFTKNALLALANLANAYGADVVQGKFPAMDKTVFPEYIKNQFWLYINFISTTMSSKLIRKGFIQDGNNWWEKQFDMEALLWNKCITALHITGFLITTKMVFSKIRCELPKAKIKKIYPIYNTMEQVDFYKKMCIRFLYSAGDPFSHFFKYKLSNILPFAEQTLAKIETKDLQIEQILRNSIMQLKQNKYITKDIYFEIIKQLIKSTAKVQNKNIFGEYKNAFVGKTIVIVAGGPTVANFIPTKDMQNAIYIGVNNTLVGTNNLKNFKHIKFDFYFNSHKFSSTNFKQALNKLHKKSIAFILEKNSADDLFPIAKLRKIDTRSILIYSNQESIQVLFNEKNWTKEIKKRPVDISKADPLLLGTITATAVHFSLFAGARKVYLVGCDTDYQANKLHFYKDAKIVKNLIPTNFHLNASNMQILSWKFMKEIAKRYYPNTEIISVNPVGLKGLFHKDIYTKSQYEL